MNIVLALSLSYIVYSLMDIIMGVVYRKYSIYKGRLDKIEKQNLIGFKTGKQKKSDKTSGLKISVPEKLQESLVMAGIHLKPEEFIMIWAIVTLFPLLIGMLFSLNVLIIFLLMMGGLVAPVVVLSRKKKKRSEKFNNQLGDAIMIISNSLRAGFTFEQALKTVSQDLPDPIGSEFRKVVREVNLGEQLEVAMEEVAEKMQSEDMQLMNTAVAIQRQVGGNLADVLDNIGLTIRDRIIMKKNIKAMTAQGEISGKVIGFLPIALLVMISFINPDYMEPVFTTPFGYALLGVSAFLEISGYIMIKKLINIEV